ncbi:AsnC family protein [Amycolatopsis sp. NPDC004079]|uniref:AsnC family protein n=1 Tax=Amycolatopsis sp. NPDC004079 TaxID=3154549 RepID=UPI0033B3A7D1
MSRQGRTGFHLRIGARPRKRRESGGRTLGTAIEATAKLRRIPAEVDLKLVNSLQADPLAPLSSIGATAGTSAVPAARRRQRLTGGRGAWPSVHQGASIRSFPVLAFVETDCAPGRLPAVALALTDDPSCRRHRPYRWTLRPPHAPTHPVSPRPGNLSRPLARGRTRRVRDPDVRLAPRPCRQRRPIARGRAPATRALPALRRPAPGRVEPHLLHTLDGDAGDGDIVNTGAS